MKRIIVALVLLASPLLAFDEVLFEAKTAYYYPYNDTTRDIFDGGGVALVETTIHGYRNLYPFFSAGVMPLYGKSIGSSSTGPSDVDILFVPLAAGVKWICPITKRVDIYLGAGFLGGYIHSYEDSPFVLKTRTKWDWGGVYKAGFNINLYEGLFLDVFTDYMQFVADYNNTAQSIGRKADLSGFLVGFGLGYMY